MSTTPVSAPLPMIDPSRPAAPLPWLVADLGGTNARFGWVAEPGAAVAHVQTLCAAEHAGPVKAAGAYLAQLRQRLGDAAAAPRSAALAVATAVAGDEVVLTNSGWRFSRQQVQAQLGLACLRVLNDFEALALALPHLSPAQCHAIGPAGSPLAGSALAVVGPGTGLGVAAVVPSAAGWLAVPGEGGHATLAPTNARESAVLAAARREFAHVSAERLLSGIGLPVLHRAVVAVDGSAADSARALAAPWSAEQIVEHGLAGADAHCSATIDLFCALLGSFAGNVALTFGARGGLYVGGGIVPRLGARFAASDFRARFEAKGRFAPYLRDIPTRLITDTLAALTGACAALR